MPANVTTGIHTKDPRDGIVLGAGLSAVGAWALTRNGRSPSAARA